MSSLKDQLLAARAAVQHSKTSDFEIPGYSGRLGATFRALDDYSEVRAIIKRHERVPDEALRELYVAADTLVEASTDTFALVDGEQHALGVTLGLPLYGYLELDEGAENDRQAVFALFPSTMSLMTLFADYDQWMKGAQRKTESELAGKSDAPS